MIVEITRGSNPSIAVKMADITLSPTFDETIGESEVTRKSLVTIRKSCESEGSILTSDGELQIEMDSTGSVEDIYGNVFEIDGDTATVRLNRNYTRLLTQPVYFIQFNLIDEDGNLFVVEDPPMALHVRRNLADLSDADGD